MKILYLITKSNWGGAQKYVYDLSTSFRSKGIDTVVVFGGKDELYSKLSEVDIKTYPLSSLVRDVSLIREFFVVKELYNLIKKEKPDILHVNSSKAAGIGALVGRLTGVPSIVATIHGAPFREDRRPMTRRMIYFFTWLTCVFSHKVITVSKQDEADIGAMFFIKKKVTTIYNGIAVTGLPPKRLVPRGRETHIVSIGEFTNNKGYLYGLEAVNTLVKKGIPIHYTIEGEGEDRQKIEEYIAMKKLGGVVTLLGKTLTTNKNLHEYDVFLLSSVKEGLPYTLIEAGMAMLPVVTTITGGIPEIIRHEETGLLVQPKDGEALSSALERVIQDRKYAKQLGQKLHSHIVQNFSYSKMLVETAKVYGFIEEKRSKREF